MSVCSVVAPPCTAPAGWQTGAGYAKAPGQNLPRCYQCGDHVCRACSTKVGRSVLCLSCQESNVNRVLR